MKIKCTCGEEITVDRAELAFPLSQWGAADDHGDCPLPSDLVEQIRAQLELEDAS
jgi:hypothetical protein